MLSRLFHILFSFFLLLFIANCAKIGSPAGGPRDKTPPVILKSKPLNRSVGYHGKQIEITFDEYIRTDALSQELVVSPPLEERPEIRLKGKTLVIEWEEDLPDSTTYTFSFGEAIKDLNEGNILKNFEFVFSTGEYIDSLSIIGTVIQAFNLQSHKEKVFLLLHGNLSDSAPLLEKPDYVGIANDRGNFLINNLRPGRYRLFALQDQNRNYKYDVPGETIGFLDTTVFLSPAFFITEPDSSEIDTSEFDSSAVGFSAGDSSAVGFSAGDSSAVGFSAGDTSEFDSSAVGFSEINISSESPGSLMDSVDFSMSDSVLTEQNDSLTLADLAPWSIFVDVFLFLEDKEPQYLIDNTRKDRRKLSLRFNKQVEDTVIIKPYNFEVERDWYIYEPHIMRDTFVYWLNDSLIYNNDSLELLVTYDITDSLNNLVPFHDTLKFNYREPVVRETRRNKKDEEIEEKEETISIELSNGGRQDQELNSPFSMEIQHPVSHIDTSRITLMRVQDSLEFPVPFNLAQHPLKMREFYMNVNWTGITTYRLNVYPNSFTDIYGLTNDTVSLQFKTRDPEYYGRILLALSGITGPSIIQVLDDSENPVRQKRISSDGLVEFDYMPPEAFTLKLIHDRNENGEWDTGDYLNHLQPEAVEYLPGKVTIRSNFDMEVDWKIENEEIPEEENLPD